MTDALSTPTQPAASSPVVTTDEGQAKGLTLDSVTLTFADGDRSFNALDDVNLRVAPGEIVAIVGPSGAGKSSLLAVAGGLTMPTSGRVEVDGIEVSSLAARALARFRRDHIGFVFQTSNLVPALTAIDQLRLVEKITGRRSSRTPAELLEQVGMSEHAKRRPGRLSGGERQRVGIARALASDPSVLLVDEPTAALDRKRSHEIVALLAQETRTAGVATVMVTHDHDILGQCDRVLEMLDGRLTETGASTH